jgi:hypothetical protein
LSDSFDKRTLNVEVIGRIVRSFAPRASSRGMSDLDDTRLPYYFADLPSFSEWSPDPSDALRTKRRCYWSADLQGSQVAGHAYARARDVRRWFKGAGFTEVLVTYDLKHIAPVVAMLRQAHEEGHRAPMFAEPGVPT